jgi:hypothetical protein
MDDLNMLKILVGAHGLQAHELSKQEQAKLESIRSELRAIRAEQDQEKRLPQCPVCGGRLEGQFRKCKHCTSDLVWLEGVPCEPGKEAELLARLEVQRKQEAKRKVDREASRRKCSRCESLCYPWQMRGDLCAACIEVKQGRATKAMVGIGILIFLGVMAIIFYAIGSQPGQPAMPGGIVLVVSGAFGFLLLIALFLILPSLRS